MTKGRIVETILIAFLLLVAIFVYVGIELFDNGQTDIRRYNDIVNNVEDIVFVVMLFRWLFLQRQYFGSGVAQRKRGNIRSTANQVTSSEPSVLFNAFKNSFDNVNKHLDASTLISSDENSESSRLIVQEK